MKRSEMVEQLINAIVDNIPEISDVTFEESSSILKRLEELGMLPPSRRGSSSGQTYNTWEFENE
jgi:Ni,Fe-hydrogenase III large subunit